MSVIIPCYRCKDTIERATDSVLAQTQLPMELILVDDDSGDGTFDLLKKIQAHLGPEWVKVIPLQHNGGPSTARNAGWNLASQPYLAFLDADDSWHPEKLEIQYQWMQANPSVVLTGHDTLWIRSQTQSIKLPMSWRVDKVVPMALLLSNCFSTPSIMLRQALHYRFQPAKRFSEDYLLWLQIVLDGHDIYHLELPLAYLFKAPFGERGLSSKLWEMERGELDTFSRLRSEGRIGWFTTVIISGYSLLKFLRRVVMVQIRRVSSRF